MIIPEQPEFPPGMLATFELRDYRAALETALTAAPEGAPERQVIAERLKVVKLEQASRARRFTAS